MATETTAPPRGIEPLMELLDGAVTLGSVEEITRVVQLGLSRLIHAGELSLPAALRRTAEGHYARRLVYRSDELGYVVVAMIWDRGQGTPLHDHSGAWCVEGVLEGRILVTQFDLVGEEDGICRFERRDAMETGVGSAGALIPPFEYHTIANAREEPTITLHVYGRDMETCGVFEPRGDGTWLRREKALSYDA